MQPILYIRHFLWWYLSESDITFLKGSINWNHVYSPFKYKPIKEHLILAEGPGVARGKKNQNCFSRCHSQATHKCQQQISAHLVQLFGPAVWSSCLAGFREHIQECLVLLYKDVLIRSLKNWTLWPTKSETRFQSCSVEKNSFELLWASLLNSAN